MIQIRQPQHSATVIRLNSVFAHGDGLPCRRIGTTANRLGEASIRRVWTGRVLSAIAWLQQLTDALLLAGFPWQIRRADFCKIHCIRQKERRLSNLTCSAAPVRAADIPGVVPRPPRTSWARRRRRTRDARISMDVLPGWLFDYLISL